MRLLDQAAASPTTIAELRARVVTAGGKRSFTAASISGFTLAGRSVLFAVRVELLLGRRVRDDGA
jgi:hypothetical protein